MELVTYPNGAVAPAKTPEVAAAEAAHFAAKGLPAWGAYPYGAYGWNGYAGAYAGAYNGWAGYNNYGYAGYPYAAWGGYPYAPVAPYYAPGFAGLVAHPNGALVPAEPADVVAARADHLAAHASEENHLVCLF